MQRIVTYQTFQRMVRHISRGIAKGVSAAMAENNRRLRRLHGDQHRGHGNVRQIHHHSESIHLEDDTLETFGRWDIIGISFEYREDGDFSLRFFFLFPSFTAIMVLEFAKRSFALK